MTNPNPLDFPFRNEETPISKDINFTQNDESLNDKYLKSISFSTLSQKSKQNSFPEYYSSAPPFIKTRGPSQIVISMEDVGGSTLGLGLTTTPIPQIPTRINKNRRKPEIKIPGSESIARSVIVIDSVPLAKSHDPNSKVHSTLPTPIPIKTNDPASPGIQDSAPTPGSPPVTEPSIDISLIVRLPPFVADTWNPYGRDDLIGIEKPRAPLSILEQFRRDFEI